MNYQKFTRSHAIRFNLSKVSNERAKLALFQASRCTCGSCSARKPDDYCRSQTEPQVLVFSTHESWEARPGDVVFSRGDRHIVLRYGKELAAFTSGVKFRSEGIRANPALPF